MLRHKKLFLLENKIYFFSTKTTTISAASKSIRSNIALSPDSIGVFQYSSEQVAYTIRRQSSDGREKLFLLENKIYLCYNKRSSIFRSILCGLYEKFIFLNRLLLITYKLHTIRQCFIWVGAGMYRSVFRNTKFFTGNAFRRGYRRACCGRVCAPVAEQGAALGG